MTGPASSNSRKPLIAAGSPRSSPPAGRRAHLASAGINAHDVGGLTGYPPLFDGRVKTLHPKVFGAILADRRNPVHLEEAALHEIPRLDYVVVNLYPFEKTVAREGASLEEALEQIDIGGVSLLRAAAKNFERVTVLSDPAQYAEVIAALAATARPRCAPPARDARVRADRRIRFGDRAVFGSRASRQRASRILGADGAARDPAALRRESAGSGRVLSAARRVSSRAIARQGPLLQQPARSRRLLASAGSRKYPAEPGDPDGGERRPGTGSDREAHRAVRGRRACDGRRRDSRDPRGRSGLGIRRHRSRSTARSISPPPRRSGEFFLEIVAAPAIPNDDARAAAPVARSNLRIMPLRSPACRLERIAAGARRCVRPWAGFWPKRPRSGSQARGVAGRERTQAERE